MEAITQKELDEFVASVIAMTAAVEKNMARVGLAILAAKGAAELPLDVGGLGDELATLSSMCERSSAYLSSVCSFAQGPDGK